MPQPFGIGIVGAGTIGKVHAAAIAALPPARLIVVADPREDAARALAAAHGAAVDADLDALLARPEVDVVLLATPSGLHAAQAVAAARAGKHVVTEKPMAIGLAGADRMIAAARAASVALAVIFQNRFHHDALRLQRAVAAGLLGRPLLGNAFVHWRRTGDYFRASGGWRGTLALDGGGALINQSIHTIDLLTWIRGPVASLAAESATLVHSIEGEDTASATLRFASGALGTIQGTTAAGEDWPTRLEIVGTAGRAVLEGTRLSLWQGTREADAAALFDDRDRAWTAGSDPDEPFGAAHTRQWRAILAALAAGQPPPVAGEDARRSLELVLAIYRASARARRVDLPLPAGGDEEQP